MKPTYKKDIIHEKSNSRLATIDDDLDRIFTDALITANNPVAIIKVPFACPECEGKGYIMDKLTREVHTCWTCMGTGVIK